VFFATYTPRQKTIKFICAVRGGKSATLFSTYTPRQKTIKFICAVRGAK